MLRQYLYLLNFFFGGEWNEGLGYELRALSLTKQMFYHLSHTSRPKISLMKVRGMAQEVEHVFSKCKALTSNSTTAKNKTKLKQKIITM
jgi:hypothetical protein